MHLTHHFSHALCCYSDLAATYFYTTGRRHKGKNRLCLFPPRSLPRILGEGAKFPTPEVSQQFPPCTNRPKVASITAIV
jgi:hypothetical protein